MAKNEYKNEWKNKIDGSLFFSLHPDTQEALREREKNKLIREVIAYTFQHEKWSTEYGVEVWETVNTCLRSFDAEKCKSFMAYYLVALNRNQCVWDATAYYDRICRGRKMDKEKLYVINRLIREEEASPDGGIETAAFLDKVAKTVGVPLYEAGQMLDALQGKTMELDKEISSEDGDSAGDHGNVIPDTNAEKAFREIEEGDAATLFLEIVASTFEKLQQRQKRLISMMMTSKLFDIRYSEEDMCRFSFYSEEAYRLCIEHNRSMTAREIAEIVKQDEAAVSRSWRGFYQKVKDWKAA